MAEVTVKELAVTVTRNTGIIGKLEETVYGNGHEGLVAKSARQEECINEQDKRWRIIQGLGISLLVAMLTSSVGIGLELIKLGEEIGKLMANIPK
jgi:hypothetical protein